jgi:hypothetical protein
MPVGEYSMFGDQVLAVPLAAKTGRAAAVLILVARPRPAVGTFLRTYLRHPRARGMFSPFTVDFGRWP